MTVKLTTFEEPLIMLTSCSPPAMETLKSGPVEIFPKTASAPDASTVEEKIARSAAAVM